MRHKASSDIYRQYLKLEPMNSESDRYRQFKSLTPVFIGGTSRSGTTLLQLLLNNHPQLLVYEYEDCFFREFLNPPSTFGISGTIPGLIARDVDAVLESLLVNRYGRAPFKEFEETGTLPHAPDLMFANFKEYFRAALTSVSERWSIAEVQTAWMFSIFRSLGIEDMTRYRGWVTKCPDRGKSIRFYFSAFPDCRVIHLVRDAGAYYLSYKERRKTDREFKPRLRDVVFDQMYALDGYHMSCTYARLFAAIPAFKVVKYESLVQTIEAQMKSVADFLNIAYDPILTVATFRNRPAYSNTSLPILDSGDGRVHAQSVDYWRQVVHWYDRWLIDARVGKELLHFGYRSKIHFQGIKTVSWEILCALRSRFQDPARHQVKLSGLG